MANQRKVRIDPEGLCLGNCPKKLQTHNLPTDNVENTNSTYKDIHLLPAKFPEDQENAAKDPGAQLSYSQ